MTKAKGSEKLRVYALAKELDMDSKELLAELQDAGFEFKSIQNSISRKDADAFAKGRKKGKSKATKSTKASTKAKATKATSKSTKEAKSTTKSTSKSAKATKSSKSVEKSESKAKATSSKAASKSAGKTKSTSKSKAKQKSTTRSLDELAVYLVERLESMKKVVAIDALSSQQRREMHAAIAESEHAESATTLSDGDGLFRRLIIIPPGKKVPQQRSTRSQGPPRGGDSRGGDSRGNSSDRDGGRGRGGGRGRDGGGRGRDGGGRGDSARRSRRPRR